MDIKRPQRGAQSRPALPELPPTVVATGKAFARIRYFEEVRGLAATELKRDGLRSPRSPMSQAIRRTQAGITGPAADKPTPRPATRLYYRAARERLALEPAPTETATTPVWQSLGPSHIPKGQTYGTGGNNRPPVSGRTVGVVVNAGGLGRLILASAGGGLWRSDNNGTTWAPLTDKQPTLSTGAICAAPSARHVLYAGTGEGDTFSRFGVGILRSTDAGASWTLLPSPLLADSGVYDLAVDPRNANVVWAGTTRRLLRSADGAQTWKTVLNALTWDISINPSKPDEMLVATNGGLHRSTDSGATWQRVSLAGEVANKPYERMEVCHAPSNGAVAYVFATQRINNQIKGHAWRRATAIGAFAAQPLPSRIELGQSWYDWCAAVAPDDPNLVYLGAIDVYRGKRAASGTWRWENISSRSSGDSIHPDQHHIEFDPGDAKVVFVCNDGGLFRSADRGNSWTALNKGLEITEFEFLARQSNMPGWIIGGTQDNGTLSFAGGGVWHQVAFGDGGDCGVDSSEPTNFAYHSYYEMSLERVAAKSAVGPGLAPWKDISPPTPANFQTLFYPPSDVSGHTVAQAGEAVFISANAGTQWARVDLPADASGRSNIASALVIHSARRLYVGCLSGDIFRLDRPGADWATATVAPMTRPRVGAISDIVLTGASQTTIWVTCSAFGGGHVFLSLDGGTTWADKTANLPDIPVNAFVHDTVDGRLYVATDHGVYRSVDGGASWSDFSNGLPNAVVGDLIWDSSMRLLLAGTRNRGAWQIAL